MNGKFLNPKYERRRLKRRKITLSTIIISLIIVGASAVYNVDLLIRSTMLPSAPPMASVSEGEKHQYSISILGNDFVINLSPLADLADAVAELKNTPSAPARIYHQLKAFILLDVPPNHGGDLDEVHKW